MNQLLPSQLRAITSQNGTAPKPSLPSVWRGGGAITSQNGTAPKQSARVREGQWVRLPVRTALLQNCHPAMLPDEGVRLPVRTALLQNA